MEHGVATVEIAVDQADPIAREWVSDPPPLRRQARDKVPFDLRPGQFPKQYLNVSPAFGLPVAEGAGAVLHPMHSGEFPHNLFERCCPRRGVPVGPGTVHRAAGQIAADHDGARPGADKHQDFRRPDAPPQCREGGTRTFEIVNIRAATNPDDCFTAGALHVVDDPSVQPAQTRAAGNPATIEGLLRNSPGQVSGCHLRHDRTASQREESRCGYCLP